MPMIHLLPDHTTCTHSQNTNTSDTYILSCCINHMDLSWHTPVSAHTHTHTHTHQYSNSKVCIYHKVCKHTRGASTRSFINGIGSVQPDPALWALSIGPLTGICSETPHSNPLRPRTMKYMEIHRHTQSNKDTQRQRHTQTQPSNK